MMDFKQTLQPFPLADDARKLRGHTIRYKSIALRNDEWKPYEFELGTENEIDAGFLTSVRRLLEHHRLENIGLRRYAPSDPEELEITDCEGISVKIPWNSVSSSILTILTTANLDF
jgi:hypothetical protein